MPNRDLKECNRRSASLQIVSDAAERLWYRLITSVDDFGRMEADPEVVFTTCFQRVPKGWNIFKVSRCLHELATLRAKDQEPMIKIYQVGSKSYLQINTADIHIYRRAKESKYPDPVSGVPHLLTTRETKDAHTCAQMRTDSLDLRIPNPESRSSNPAFKPVPEDDGTGSRFQEFWQAYPARNGKKLEKAATEALFRKLSIQDQALAVQAARNYAEALKDQGISAKDPKRFLRDGKGHEPWRDWIDPVQPSSASEPKKPRDPVPKAFQPAPKIDESKVDPCPPEVAAKLDRLRGSMRMVQ